MALRGSRPACGRRGGRAPRSCADLRAACSPARRWRRRARARSPAIRKKAPSRIPSRDRSGCAAAIPPRQSRAATIRRECAGRGRKSFRVPARPGGLRAGRGLRAGSLRNVGRRQSVVVADQDRVGAAHAWRSVLPVDHRFVGRKAWLKSRRYFRRPLGSLIRISRSTPARACNCASLRRSRKMEVDAISVVSLQSSVISSSTDRAPIVYGRRPLP